MYDKTNIVQTKIDEAKELVKSSRLKYNNLMKVIEEFIIDNDIIVKNNKNYFFDLYTIDTYTLPKRLTDLLYESDSELAKYVTLTIKIHKYVSRISINGITFVNFTYINPEIKKNILPYYDDCIFIDKKYQTLGPEIQLISIYGELCNPMILNEWTKLVVLEKSIVTNMIKNLKQRIYGSSDNNKKTDSDRVINILLEQYLSSNHVLVGNLAMLITMNKTIDYIPRLQIITQNTFQDEITVLKNIFSNVIYNINHLRIPTFLNLYKLTITIIYNDNKYTILDIYNAGSFEIIPFTYTYYFKKIECDNFFIKQEMQIGSPFVIKRFRLIDLWSTLYMIKANIIEKTKSIDFVINSIINDFIEITNIKKINTEVLFPTNYIGYLEDALLIKERLVNKLKIKYIPPYIPYFDKNK